MKSREIVIRTLNYEKPQRVAHSFDESDFMFSRHNVKTHETDWKKLDKNRWGKTDEWGNTWARIDETSKGEVVKGVLKTPEEVEKYILPDFSQSEDYKDTADKFRSETEKFRIGSVPGFTFNIARKLFKLEDYLVYLLTDSDQMSKLHDKIDVAIADMIINYSKAGADGFMFPEDWGTQNQTLINPELWRREFFPRTKKFCSIAHEYGLKVIMHSCGAIGAIIPGLIEAGIDCLQFDQPTIHGIDTLATYQEKGKITFWCPVDIQKTLQTEDESLIRNEASELISKLWKGRGGFIAGFYSDNASIGLDPKWQEIASDEFTRQGVLK